MPVTPQALDRRRLLAGGGAAAGLGLLAGCAGDGSAGVVTGIRGIRGAFQRGGHRDGIRVGVPVHVGLAGSGSGPTSRP